MTAVEKYVRCIASDVEKIRDGVNENGKRILDLEDKVHALTDGLDKVETKQYAKRRHLDTQKSWENTWHDQKAQQLHAEVLKWLLHDDPNINHNAASEKRNEETGVWFLQDIRFTKWKNMPGSVLWLHGIPGCGKTILRYDRGVR
jgi:predicted ATPase